MFRSLPRLATASALLLVLLTPTVALAHAELVSATPGPDDEVVGSPAVLVAQFSQDLDPSRSSLVVVDAAGTTVAEGGEPGDGPRELRLELPELAPGVYEVRWTSFSADDGELDRGTYTFTVLAEPTPSPIAATPSPVAPTPSPAAPTPSPAAPTPAPTAPPDQPTGVDDLGVLLPIGVALVVAAAIVVWLLRRQRP